VTYTGFVSRVVCLSALLPAAAFARERPIAAAPPAGGQMVPLPYVMRDSTGVQWDIGPDGQCNDGGNDLYDGGGRLTVNGNMVYQSPTQQAQFDPALNELIFPPMPMNGLNVHRRVAVNAARGWCRWTEVLENPGNQPARASLHLHWDLGGTVQQFQPIEDEKRHVQLGVAIFDGQRGLAMLCAGRAAS